MIYFMEGRGWFGRYADLNSWVRGKEMKKPKWRPYKPTPYDLARDPKLGKNTASVDWESYREFKTKESKRDPRSKEDILYRDFNRTPGRKREMLKVVENQNGGWNVVDGNGDILAVESSNSAAWRAIERLEKRMPGRKPKLYLSDAATIVPRK